MSSQYPHLNDAAAAHLELTDVERIERIRAPRWIGYPKTKQVLTKLEDLLTYPKSHRMPNLLIVGETNNGKTMLVQRFCERHPADDNPQGEGVNVPVLFIQAPPAPDEGRLYNTILDKLFAPYRPSDRVGKKQFQAIQLLRYVNLKMLVIDEIHHLMAGGMTKQRAFLNVIKYIGNELQVPVVGIGTKDAFRAIQVDPQLANRFEPVLLPRWKADKDYLRLLMSFERMVPLREPSNLHDKELASHIFAMSEGYIGEISRLLTDAAVQAVRTGREKIDKKVLKELGWFPPSKRRYRPEQGVLCVLSGTLLPAHPKPLPDELLSSWIVRIAEANAIKLHSLIRVLLPDRPDPWMRDIDRQSPAWLRQCFVRLTATPYSTVKKTSLAAYEGHIFPHNHLSGQLRWVLPIKSRSSRRFGFGLQYCPTCLATDPDPYFRKRWRLGFVTFCAEHNVMLRDACPNCGAPIAIHRRDFRKEIEEALPLSTCNQCGAWLGEGVSVPTILDYEVFQRYKQLIRSLKWPEARERSLSMDYFGVLHQLCKIIVSVPNRGALEQHICSRLGVEPQVEKKGRFAFETRRVRERYYVISLALWLMGNLTERIEIVWREKVVRFNVLLKDFWDCPEWFEKNCKKLSCR